MGPIGCGKLFPCVEFCYLYLAEVKLISVVQEKHEACPSRDLLLFFICWLQEDCHRVPLTFTVTSFSGHSVLWYNHRVSYGLNLSF